MVPDLQKVWRPCCLEADPFKYKNYHSYTMFGLWNNLYIKERCSALRKNTKKEKLLS